MSFCGGIVEYVIFVILYSHIQRQHYIQFSQKLTYFPCRNIIYLYFFVDTNNPLVELTNILAHSPLFLQSHSNIKFHYLNVGTRTFPRPKRQGKPFLDTALCCVCLLLTATSLCIYPIIPFTATTQCNNSSIAVHAHPSLLIKHTFDKV